MKRLKTLCRSGLPLFLAAPAPLFIAMPGAAFAQDYPGDITPPARPMGTPQTLPTFTNPLPTEAPTVANPIIDPQTGQEMAEIRFSSDRLEYDSNAEVVTAVGEVFMFREGYRLLADRVVWNRGSGQVHAEGSVRISTPEGDRAFGDRVELTDDLRDGVIENLLVVLEDGGRLAAVRATRANNVSTLERAAYTACEVVNEDGCPKSPSWQITAVRVIHDPAAQRIRYEGATLSLFGLPLIGLPRFSHPDRNTGGGSGLLVPDVRVSRTNGLEISQPFYLRLAPNLDATLTPHIFSGAWPMAQGEVRRLFARGAVQLRGYLTYGERAPLTAQGTPIVSDEGVRAYIEGNGRFQLNPYWSISGSGRWVTDRTFLRRYDISLDTRLRSVVQAERISTNSYISIAGWAFQGLRTTDDNGLQPIVLPAIDARWRIPAPVLGGRFEIQANSLAIVRTDGQDTQRAFASVQWDRRFLTPFGQEVVLTAFGRGDVYHASDTLLTGNPLYSGEEGWHGRLIGAVAMDIKWPFVGRFLNGTQRLTPRVQFVASPETENLDIPNEDARAVDLEDSNLFALNRFPGHDRWEDGLRVTYGADWAIDLPGVAIRSNIGQSYRLDERASIFPQGTGLADRFSDVVGRTSVQFGRNISFIHRFRIDKDDLTLRRNEIDAVAGSSETYFSIGYLRLDRDVDAALEDLRDREEVRVGGRVHFARYWSLFGSAVIDLTDRAEDPLSQSDGFDPVRHRIGISYDDDCIELGVTWRRDYETTGEVRRGNTFLIRVALRNLGR